LFTWLGGPLLLAGIVCVVKGGERLQPEPGVVVDDADPETAWRSPIAIAM
jgi:hypothetical protein